MNLCPYECEPFTLPMCCQNISDVHTIHFFCMPAVLAYKTLRVFHFLLIFQIFLSFFSFSTLVSNCSLASDVLLPLCPPSPPTPTSGLSHALIPPGSPSQHFILFSTLVLSCYFSLSPTLLAWRVYNSLLHSVRLALFTSPQLLYTLDVSTEMHHLE